MEFTTKTYYERYEDYYSFKHDSAYSSYEYSYTSCYDRAAGYDSFTGMSDDLFDDMQRSFSIKVSVACF